MRCSSRAALWASPDAKSAAARGQIHDAKVKLPLRAAYPRPEIPDPAGADTQAVVLHTPIRSSWQVIPRR
jgi:hypothetical protein